MANSNNYLAPLGMAVVGALFGIGHFSGLNETLFGSEKEYETTSQSYYVGSDYDDSYSVEYSGEISFRGKHCSGSVGCDCSGFSPITDGKEWQKSYCKKCGHARSCHK